MISQVDRQLFTLWRTHGFAPLGGAGAQPAAPRDGLRIAIVGNCQSFGYAYGMKLLAPHAQIDRYALVGRTWADSRWMIKALKTYDVVFAQEFYGGLLRDDATIDTLRAALPNLRPIPFVNFFGLHPDTVYILHPTKPTGFFTGPLGVYNSGLALFGHLRGMSIAQTAALFSRDVFAHVGYLDIWTSAAEQFLASAAACGMDLAPALAGWARRGNFLYTPNHPKGFVMFDMAKAAMGAARLPMRAIAYDDYAVDDLVRSTVLPVYPPLAEIYGFQGGELFKKEHYKLSKGTGEFMSLETFLAESFAAFSRYDPARMRHERVDQWLADDETVRALAVYSAEEMKRRALAR